MYNFDLCTLPLNLAGLCGMSLPAGLAGDTHLPVGLQIMAPAFADDRLYKVVLNDGGAMLDDMRVQDVEKEAGRPLAVVSCSPLDYFDEIADLARAQASSSAKEVLPGNPILHHHARHFQS